ncbi:hypothetical protein FJZ41_03505 [Candidatus Shapirobacteria bacterium]|nr:hypothetical protein [Candidatus Shapirobacteria bacterium]
MRIIKKLVKFLPGVVWAADEIELAPEPGSQFGRLGELTVPGIVSGAIRMLLVVSALVAFVFLIIGGIRWVTSGGDKEKTAKAQQTLTAALVGLVIVFAAWAIIKLIETFFGIQILTLTIPTVD